MYGFIGTGGLLGGILGSALVTSFVRGYSARPLILLCIVLTLAIGLFTFQADRLARQTGTSLSYHDRPVLERIRTRTTFDGVRMVMKSKYLLSIVGILALYEFCSQILDFQFSSVLAAHLSGGRDLQEYLAWVYLITDIFSLGTQCVLTSFLLNRFGPGAGLIVLPIAMALASTGFFWNGTLLMGSLLIISDNGLNYSINQTSRETLFCADFQRCPVQGARLYQHVSPAARERCRHDDFGGFYPDWDPLAQPRNHRHNHRVDRHRAVRRPAFQAAVGKGTGAGRRMKANGGSKSRDRLISRAAAATARAKTRRKQASALQSGGQITFRHTKRQAKTFALDRSKAISSFLPDNAATSSFPSQRQLAHSSSL